MAETADRRRPSSSEWLTIVVVGAGTDRLRARRADPRAGDEEPQGELPHVRSGVGPGAAARRRQGAARLVRRQAVRAADRGAGRARRRAAHGRPGHRRRRAGVDVATADGATERIAARTDLWAAGVQASPLAKALADATGAEVDRAGRIAVLPDLTLPGHPEVFAVGDMVSLEQAPGCARSPCRAACTPPTPSSAG